MIRCLTLLLLFFTSFILAAQNSLPLSRHAVFEPAGSSVLGEGKWFRMKIYSTGIYKLTYEDLVTMGFSNPQDVSIFGNGGAMLPLMNSSPRYDDLMENPVYQYTGPDGIFNQGDYILFYAQGPVTWSYNGTSEMFEHQIHSYSDAAWYFAATGAGVKKKITASTAVTASSPAMVSTFDDYNYHEKNKYNFLESGRQWFGERLDFSTFDTTFVFNNLITTSAVKIKVNVAGRSANTKTFAVSANGKAIGSIDVAGVTLTNKTGAYGNQKSNVFTLTATGDQLNLKVSYTKSSSTDEGYLDYITVNARRKLSLTGDVLFFRDISLAGTATVARYSVENCTQQTEIWNITDPFSIKKMPAQLNGTTLTFTDSTTVLNEYVVLKTGGNFPKPDISTATNNVGELSNQNLHSLGPHQMLIITNPLFKAAADSIAEFHRSQDNLTVLVATNEQVYNEFSSGAPDVSAIRDFARMLYSRGSVENRLRYLLFLGDGSYNNLSQNPGNSNFILTYQSENSLNASWSYVSDDFFGMLDETEGGSGNMEDFTLDLGIGRLPVKTIEEAMTVYRKIKNYNSPGNKGDWQNVILFAADDQDGNLHMTQSNELATWIDNHHPEVAIKKVFLDAYPQVSSSAGTRYPEVNRIISSSMEKGLLIFNYTGHGGELGLADEQIFMREDILALKNRHLPLFITATCEFSRFDDLMREEDGTLTESTSAGELSLLNPNGGSIGLITTTRIVYSSENQELNRRFYEIAFTRDPSGNYYRLGDMLKMTKNILPDSRNKLNFILLGDPALKLALPSYSVITDSINHIDVNQPMDTLRAFAKIVVSGHIEDNQNNLMSDFNGIIYPSVYDKVKTLTTLANDVNSRPMQFSTREDLIYKGKASVVNGRFTFEFLVPKDITYNFGTGRIIYYSSNNHIDAKGEFSNFVIGGTDPTALQDVNGPEINLFLNDEYFNDRGITNPNPVIYAEIKDESGINTIGNGIGHDITGIIDGNVSNPVVMNDYFESNLDDYTSGILSYPMANLSEGMHTLRVKVWDIYNNSSEAVIEFRVIGGSNVHVSRAFNYPNPARDYTTFTFEHNMPDEELTVNLSVYDLGGRLIYIHTEQIMSSGFNASLSEWDLKDSNGNLIKQGIYPYRIRIKNSKGSYSDSFHKLVVVR